MSSLTKNGALNGDGGCFHHDANPAYVWMMSNVDVKPDRNENIFPRKLRPQNKIDAAVATIVAMNRALAAAERMVVLDSDYQLMAV